MDDSSNSVYVTIGDYEVIGGTVQLFAYDGKSGNGGHCTGAQLGEITSSGFCVDLNTFYDSRIKCLRFKKTTAQ